MEPKKVKAALTKCRVCVLTITRTIEIQMLSVAQMTRTYVSTAFLTILEPFLGIIACSLPVLRPVLQIITTTVKKGHDPSSADDDKEVHVDTIGCGRNVIKPWDSCDIHANVAPFSSEAHNKVQQSGRRSLQLVLPPYASDSDSDA